MSGRNQKTILAEVKRLAAEYYVAANRPLGIVGELAEFEAAEKLDLQLADARTAGYDAIRMSRGCEEKIQVKGRRIAAGCSLYRGRVPKIDLRQPFDAVVLVLMKEDYETAEIWEAPRDKIVARLTEPGSKARTERGSLAISQFKSIADKVWPEQD